MQEVCASNPTPDGLLVSPGTDTLKSRVSGPRSTPQGHSIRSKKDCSESKGDNTQVAMAPVFLLAMPEISIESLNES